MSEKKNLQSEIKDFLIIPSLKPKENKMEKETDDKGSTSSIQLYIVIQPMAVTKTKKNRLSLVEIFFDGDNIVDSE